MEFKEKRSFKNSLKHCLEGINYVIKHEKNFSREIFLGIVALVLSFVLKISTFEFIVVLLLINFVLIMELINTALERVVDLYTKEYNELAKAVKDISAGSVLVMSFFSLLIGAIIYIPKIINVLVNI